MIRLLQHFRGVLTNERPILPGDYADDDPALFGIAAYLIEHKFAVRIDEPLPVVAPESHNEPAPNIEIIEDEFNGTISRNVDTGEERVIKRASKRKK